MYHKVKATCSTWLNKLLMRISQIEYGKGFHSYGRIVFRNYVGYKRIKFNNNVEINSYNGGANPGFVAARSMFIVVNDGNIILGNNVHISNSVLFSSTYIHIGDNTIISPGCKIFDTDFHSVKSEYRLNGNTHVPSKAVKIGSNVFLGVNVTVLKGVTIGDEAVVGAGSIVTKDIPAGEIWAGNPARFIKKCG